MKNKFNDNRLAEEFDLIVLIKNSHRAVGFPAGAIGTLTYAYTGQNNFLYALFENARQKKELAVKLNEFRVLNIKNERDLSIVTTHLKNRRVEKIIN